VQSTPLGIAASSPRSPLLGAYDLWSNARFSECLAELERIQGKLRGETTTEAALLAARAYLRLDRADDALHRLSQIGPVEDVDVRCTVAALRGFSMVSAGRSDSGMEVIRQAIELSEASNSGLVARMDAVFHKAFAHWLRGEFDEAEASAQAVAAARIDILSARAVGLIGWVAVGKLDYPRALRLFHAAWRSCRSCVARDIAFEASVVHCIATFESQLLDSARKPYYYGPDLPGAGKAIDAYRLLVGSVDSWRATLAGDQGKALEFAASTEALDVADHWRVFGMVSRAGVLQAFGHVSVGKAVSVAAFHAAMILDWRRSPGESRLALLYLAERLAPHELERAQACLAHFSRIESAAAMRYFGGRHALHAALESYSRGVVAAAAGEESAASSLETAARTFERIGFRWRAADAWLLLGRTTSVRTGEKYQGARAFISRSFPRSHIMRELYDVAPRIKTGSASCLTGAQVEIVRALCAGRSPRSIAADRGTSLGTVRNQLKDVYRRSGCRSIQSVVSTFYRAFDGDRRD
jgi:DNA-binding CsgD family transcriptional regulator/tetratricopeptide (TPR) repeat protein